MLPSQATGLIKDSVANLSQILTADKTFLVERAGALLESLHEEVDEGLRAVLYLVAHPKLTHPFGQFQPTLSRAIDILGQFS